MDCNDILGATGQTYDLTADDVDFTIRVLVTASNAAGSAAAHSSATGPVGASDTTPEHPAVTATAVSFDRVDLLLDGRDRRPRRDRVPDPARRRPARDRRPGRAPTAIAASRRRPATTTACGRSTPPATSPTRARLRRPRPRRAPSSSTASRAATSRSGPAAPGSRSSRAAPSPAASPRAPPPRAGALPLQAARLHLPRAPLPAALQAVSQADSFSPAQAADRLGVAAGAALAVGHRQALDPQRPDRRHDHQHHPDHARGWHVAKLAAIVDGPCEPPRRLARRRQDQLPEQARGARLDPDGRIQLADDALARATTSCSTTWPSTPRRPTTPRRRSPAPPATARR